MSTREPANHTYFQDNYVTPNLSSNMRLFADDWLPDFTKTIIYNFPSHTLYTVGKLTTEH